MKLFRHEVAPDGAYSSGGLLETGFITGLEKRGKSG